MPTLDPNSWSRFDHDALDRHITGNWGEDAFLGDIDDTAPLELEPPMRLVYIRECAEESIPWYIYDAHTQEFITACGTQHGAVEYCTSEGWDVRDGPVAEEEDDEVVGDDLSDEGLGQGYYAEEAYFTRETEDDEGAPGTGGFYGE